MTVATPVCSSAASLDQCSWFGIRKTLRDIDIPAADDASANLGVAVAERLAAEDACINVLQTPAHGGKQAWVEPAGEASVVLVSPSRICRQRLRLALHAVVAPHDRPAEAC